MIHAIFGFDAKLEIEQKWIFNSNHLFLALAVFASVVLLSLIISPKTEMGKKITKIVIASILFLLEIGRMIYRFRYNIYCGQSASTMNWWGLINFENCSIVTWVAICTLFAGSFVKKDNKILQFFYNAMFGCGILGGLLTFVYPLTISGAYPIYHFSNMQTIITHILIMTAPILVVKMGDFKVELKKVWQLIPYYIIVGCITLTASMCSGTNFAFTLYINWMYLPIPFPFHVYLLVIVFVAVAAVEYSIFDLCRHIKNKRLGVAEPKKHFNKTDLLVIIAMMVTCVIITYTIGTTIALNVWHGEPTPWGLLELFTLAYFLLSMAFINYYGRYLHQRFDVERTAKHTTLILCFCIINLPAGIVYLIRYVSACKQLNKQNQ
ncbi:MAG: YwaF family protein [Clostridia bacterium]|nr:YwaF family protein [Clostridia bacterium]